MEKATRRKKRFWEQTIPIEETKAMRVYRCPECGTVLFEVPADEPVPNQKVEMTCPDGHKVLVPDFKHKIIRGVK